MEKSKLLTAKEIAETQGVTVRYIKQQFAELDIDPVMDNNMNFVVHKIGPGSRCKE